ncbi:hypothetical protein [Sphingomonas sp.]|uniref:hypothetical protein n=1 Tax=Sphingomonas sp. TaxID=28214 RepID=UPI0017B6D691|nr:hypothetical protein [Sphingomonas sp.]MBA4760366.1 hypothetical protein [Sphingomonas sp.]
MDIRLLLVGAVLTLGACDRIDPLSVTESPNGLYVIHDSLGTRTERRFICIRPKKDPSCSPSDADVIIASVGQAVEANAVWDKNSQVLIRLSSGKVERAARTVLNGNVSIRIEK